MSKQPIRCRERFYGKQCTLIEDHKDRGLFHHSFVVNASKKIVRCNELGQILIYKIEKPEVKDDTKVED